MVAPVLLSRLSSRVAIVAALLMPFGGQSVPLRLDSRVPISLRAAARTDPAAFATELAKAGIPASFVLHADTDAARRSSMIPQSVSGQLTLRHVVDVFTKEFAGYQIAVVSDVLRVRSVQPTVCDAPLGARIGVFQGSGTDESVANDLVVASKGGHRGGPVRGGSIGSGKGREAREKENPMPVLSLSVQDTTLEESLDAIARRLQRTVWIAEENVLKDGTTQCQLRLVRGDGTASWFMFDLAR